MEGIKPLLCCDLGTWVGYAQLYSWGGIPAGTVRHPDEEQPMVAFAVVVYPGCGPTGT